MTPHLRSVILLSFALIFSFCQLSASQACFEYLGCFAADDEDTYDSKDFPHGQMYNAAITPLTCLTYCRDAFGDKYAGIRNSKVCRCGSSIASNASTDCKPCNSDTTASCGASSANSIYTFAACGNSETSRPITAQTATTPVVVVRNVAEKRQAETAPLRTGAGTVQTRAESAVSSTSGTGFGSTTATTTSNSSSTGLTTGGASTTGGATVTQIVGTVGMTGNYTAFNVTQYCDDIADGLNVTHQDVDCSKSLSKKRAAAQSFVVTITITLPSNSPLINKSETPAQLTSSLTVALNNALNSSSVTSYLNATGTVAAPASVVVHTNVPVTTGGGGGGGSDNKVALGVGLGLGLGLGIPLVIFVAYMIIKRRNGGGNMNPIVPPPYAEANPNRV